MDKKAIELGSDIYGRISVILLLFPALVTETVISPLMGKLRFSDIQIDPYLLGLNILVNE